MSGVKLWGYRKSSASYRVRIALNLAGIDYKIKAVDLLAKAHKSPEHIARNLQRLVPVLDIDGERFTQSLAILEYLDTTRNRGLLSRNTVQRAKAKALAHTTCCRSASHLQSVCRWGADYSDCARIKGPETACAAHMAFATAAPE